VHDEQAAGDDPKEMPSTKRVLPSADSVAEMTVGVPPFCANALADSSATIPTPAAMDRASFAKSNIEASFEGRRCWGRANSSGVARTAQA
jgi:hypothetical protein